MYSNTDTIAAIATPPGRGGIGIIRVSGPLALHLAQAVTHRALTPRYATFCSFVDSAGELIDRGLAIIFTRPLSFTGEDVAEFHLHGNRFVLDRLLGTLCGHGARLAEPGEFSARAFFNGKMDLAQAEALADLVNASSDRAARAALASLQGEFSRQVNQIVEGLTRLRVLLEANLDFAEEDTGYVPLPELWVQVNTIEQRLQDLVVHAHSGCVLEDGCRIAIIGRPNAGKSTLLNALSRTDCAIVADSPGTTRDLICTTVTVNGIPVHLTDTAGLREPADGVEAEGIKRTHLTSSEADLILAVVDVREPSTMSHQKAWLQDINPRAIAITVLNKIDLIGMPAAAEHNGAETYIYLSAQTGEGLPLLEAAIERHCGALSGNGAFSARRRHIDSLERAQEVLKNVREAANAETLVDDQLAESLRYAQEQLGKITGTVTSEALLGEIFQSFCIGK